jgi:hypothetical protein
VASPCAHPSFLNEGHAFTEPERIDNIIRAELPNRALDPDGSLTEVVKRFMVHGPCGTRNPNASCMQRKHPGAPCYPRGFCETTVVNEDGYPTYRRRHVVDGEEVTWGENFSNRCVILYNPFVSLCICNRLYIDHQFPRH